MVIAAEGYLAIITKISKASPVTTNFTGSLRSVQKSDLLVTEQKNDNPPHHHCHLNTQR